MRARRLRVAGPLLGRSLFGVTCNACVESEWLTATLPGAITVLFPVEQCMSPRCTPLECLWQLVCSARPLAVHDSCGGTRVSGQSETCAASGTTFLE